MMNISQKILFFGTEDFSLTALKGLIEAGFPIAAVITKPDRQQGRGQRLTPPEIKRFAESCNIPVWQPEKLRDIEDAIRAFQPAVGVLVSYGKIIPQSTIELFNPGIINIHPSLLPKYRGPSPIEAAILNGDQETGVSIMQLSAAMDAGPVYDQFNYPLTGSEDQITLMDTLAKKGTERLIELLPSILNGSLLPTPQDDSHASYCQLIKKSDAAIDWNKPAVQIEREIRAYRSWPQSRTQLGRIEIIITKATAVGPIEEAAPGKIDLTIESDTQTLLVSAGDGSIKIEYLKPLGKKEMPVQAFLAGYSKKLEN